MKRPRTIGIVQARLGSTRLPGKVLLKLGKDTVLDILLSRLEESTTIDELAVATSTNPIDDPLERHTRELGIHCYRGSELDVLDRLFQTSRNLNAEVIVRLTGDNPLVDLDLLDKQVIHLVEENQDYTSTGGLILGLGSEAVSFNALESAANEAKETYQREHVTPFIYENNERFKVEILDPPLEFSRNDVRLTIDTEDDFKLFEHIVGNFGSLVGVSTTSVLRFLDTNPSIRQGNIHVEQKGIREVEE